MKPKEQSIDDLPSLCFYVIDNKDLIISCNFTEKNWQQFSVLVSNISLGLYFSHIMEAIELYCKENNISEVILNNIKEDTNKMAVNIYKELKIAATKSVANKTQDKPVIKPTNVFRNQKGTA